MQLGDNTVKLSYIQGQILPEKPPQSLEDLREEEK